MLKTINQTKQIQDVHDTRKPEVPLQAWPKKGLDTQRGCLSVPVVVRGPSIPRSPVWHRQVKAGFIKLQTPIYLPKALARAASTNPASGCPQGPNSVFQEQGMAASLWRWSSVPPGAMVMLLPLGSQGRRWIPAPSSQEGTFSFGVPKKNCRTRSARSARQKSRARTWPMTSLNCQGGGR